jgi:hypothetical protein
MMTYIDSERSTEMDELRTKLNELDVALRAERARRPSARLGRALLRPQLRLALLSALVIVPTAAYAAFAFLPFAFTNGTLADANEVNANFASLASAIDSNIPVRSVIVYSGVTTVVPAANFVYEKMRVLGTFTKVAGDTDILLTWNSHVFQDGGFANWQLRVDDQPIGANPGAGAAVVSNGTPGSAVSLVVLFASLSTGQHEVSLWVRSNDTTTVWDNGGNYERQVLVEEQFTQ